MVNLIPSISVDASEHTSGPIENVRQGFTGLQVPSPDPNVLFRDIDVLSLDVFDTILVRRCLAPQDVFSWIEARNGQAGFARNRVMAEAAARKAHRDRGMEVTLEEIYAILEAQGALPAADAIQAVEQELCAEETFLFRSPSAAALIEEARARGIRIIAVSDIYLQSHQVARLLRSCDVDLDEVYASADFCASNLGKYNGTIFDHVAMREGVAPNRILHIGDNRVSDVLHARAAGWNGVLISQMHDVMRDASPLIQSVADLASSATGRIIAGQMTHAVLNDRVDFTGVTGFGYSHGGPLLLGTVQFLIERARALEIDHFVLLERDGNILKEALDLLEPHLGPYTFSYRLMPSSRRMALFPCCASDGFDAIANFFDDCPAEITTQAFFDVLHIAPPTPEAQAHAAVVSTPQQHFETYEAALLAQAELEKTGLMRLLSDELQMHSQGTSIAWFDVGWGLTSASALNRLFDVAWPCLCIGSHELTSQDLPQAGYLFERGQPVELTLTLMHAAEVIELIFSATSQQVIHAQPQGDQSCEIKRVPHDPASDLRNLYVQDIWAGALAFLEDMAPLAPGLYGASCRELNIVFFSSLIERREPWVTEMLGAIPHSRTAGHAIWKTIGEYWSERKSRTPRKHKPIRDFIVYNLLTFLAQREGLFSSKRRKKFLRSAAKRSLSRDNSARDK